jgi:ABC-2 type transport system ATP-binding protein
VDAVADLNLEVRRGEIFAFLGPNGAGKTTTINLLMGFLQPTRGRVALFGSNPNDRRVRARLGYLPENYAFHSFLTAPALLNFFGRLFRLSARERRERIERLLQQLGLWEARNKKIGQYSRGMRQRLGIAQALLNEPDLLILDEPTSGFDPFGRRMVRDLLLGLKQRGASIFLSSHILSEVETICDRVAIINRGRLVKQGTLPDVVGAQMGYEITFTGPASSIVPRLREMGGEVTLHHEQMKVVAKDEELAQAVVDAIRAGGGRLKAFVPATRTLEEVFLDFVSESEHAQEPFETGRE